MKKIFSAPPIQYNKSQNNPLCQCGFGIFKYSAEHIGSIIFGANEFGHVTFGMVDFRWILFRIQTDIRCIDHNRNCNARCGCTLGHYENRSL